MHPLEALRKNLGKVEEVVGHFFYDKELLLLAFTHRSFVNEHRALVPHHNERLEFLGDSVLGLIAAAYLYEHLPEGPEGELSKLRSRLVDAPSCASYLQKLKLEPYILLGRGEKLSDKGVRGSILADVFEALMGALYLDGGLEAARTFFLTHFGEKIEALLGSPPRNFKAELQDFSQKNYQKPPTYQVIEESGPDHAKRFLVSVSLDGEELGLGEGLSKKEAEQRAAEKALDKLGGGRDG